MTRCNSFHENIAHGSGNLTFVASLPLLHRSVPGSCRSNCDAMPLLPLRKGRVDYRQAVATGLRMTSSSSSSQSQSSSSSTNTSSPRVEFPSLTADSFRHPVDIRATRTLRGLTIWFEPFLRFLFRRVEDTFFFENITSGVQVTSTQYGSIHKDLLEACKILNVSIPEVYIRQNSTPNAYTLAVQGDKSFIVIHSSLIDLLSKEELQAVIAHELGHLKSEHGLWITMANLIILLLPTVTNDALSSRLLTWQRAAELSCDRAMLLVTQDINVAMSALMKLTGGVTKLAHEMNVDQFLQQAERFDRASNKSWLGRQLRESMIASTTHPLPILRVRELKRWSESNHFRSLITSGKKLSE